MKKILLSLLVALIILNGCTEKKEALYFEKNEIDLEQFGNVCITDENVILGCYNIDSGEYSQIAKVDYYSDDLMIENIDDNYFIENDYYFDKYSKQYYICNSEDSCITICDENMENISKVDVCTKQSDKDLMIDFIGNDSENAYFRVYDENKDNEKLIILDRNNSIVYNNQYLYDCILNTEKWGVVFILTNEDENATWTHYNSKKGDFEELKNAPLSGKKTYNMLTEGYFIDGDNDNEIYYCKTEEENILMAVNKGNSEQLLDFNEYNVNLNYCGMPVVVGNGCFLLFDTCNNKLIRLKTCDEENFCIESNSMNNVEKVTLKIAGMGENDLTNLITDFNIVSEKYEIEYVDYMKKSKNESRVAEMIYKDILKGNDIDAVMLSKLDKDAYISNGVLADLNAYFEQSTSISKDDFVNGVIESVTEEDGAIYSIYPSYTLEGYISKAEDNLDISKIKEYNDLLANKGKVLLAAGNNFEMMEGILKYSGEKIVDYNNACIQDNDEFKSLLETLKNQYDNKEMSCIGDNQLMMYKDKTYFCYADIFRAWKLYYYDKIIQNEYSISNYCVNAPVIVPGTGEIGVLANSDNIEGMYNFLDFVFNVNNYKKYKMNQSKDFLVRNDVMNEVYKEFSASKGFIDAFGDFRYSASFEGNYNDEFDVSVSEVPIEKIDYYKKIVESAVYVKPMDYELMEIIANESEGYFEGSSDIDTTLNSINEKVSNYLRENK